MSRMLYVISEGKTEVDFVKQVLSQHLLQFGWIAKPVTLQTGSNKAGVRKGGWRRTDGYQHGIKEIHRVIKTHKSAIYTTFFDLYGFPNDISCYNESLSISSPYEKVLLYEAQLAKDVAELFIGDTGFRADTFIPYVQPYEFECFLFIDPERTAAILSSNDNKNKNIIETNIANDAKHFKSPEHINDSTETAPSKRLAKIVPGFDKLKSGKSGFSWKVTEEIGIDRIRQECLHFNEWLTKIESF